MSKKQKKRDKDKKRKRKSSDADDTLAAKDADTNHPAVTVSLNTNLTSVAPGCSWGSAFAAAASIQPEALDDDFLTRTASTEVDEGLSQISKLAETTNNQQEDEPLSSKPLKRPKKASETPDEIEQVPEDNDMPTLEGRMVPHPHQDGTQVMVLVDPARKRVYSAMQRTSSGNLIRMGKLKKNTIRWDDTAFPEPAQGVPSTTTTGNEVESEAQPSFPFETDPDDHCESPLESYRDILPFLQNLAHTRKDLAIYDPYFCDGAVKRNLAELGFPNVHNQKEDCYQVWSSGVGYPNFHVLLTNPPYSNDHIPQLMEHVTHRNFGNRPWFLLMPNWVHKKDYYKKATANIQPFYLVPKKRYVYLPPKHFRDKRVSDVHKKSSPFVSMWYIWGGTADTTELWIAQYQETLGKNAASCDLARTQNALRDLRRKGKP